MPKYFDGFVGIRSLLLLLDATESGTHRHFQVSIWKRAKNFSLLASLLLVCVCVYECFWCHRKQRHRFCFLCKPSHSIKINFAKYLLATNLKRRDTLKQQQQRQHQSPPLTKTSADNISRENFYSNGMNWMRFCVCVFPVLFLLLYVVAGGVWLPATQNRDRISRALSLLTELKISRIFADVANFLFHLQIMKWINKTIIRLRAKSNMWIYRLPPRFLFVRWMKTC